MELLAIPAIWFCWKWSELVDHIRTHGLSADPVRQKKWDEKQRAKART
jgi:hypothetical protein